MTENDDQRFYVLGLAPNAARIAVRFWQVATVKEIGERLCRLFDDLAIDRPDREPPFPNVRRLCLSLATQRKAENVPHNLVGDWLRAVLAGVEYPRTLLLAAVRRCRAEQEVDYARAAIVKASINGSTHAEEEKLTVSLDRENLNVGYRLGRLFAVLERLQEEAHPGLNATIRDRYYGAASSAPATVFPILLRLKNHHLSKLENQGRAHNIEKLLGEVIDGLDAATPFPHTLRLDDQGRFAVGYYHQRQHASTYRAEGDK